MEEKEKYLVDMLNKLFKIKNITYGEFNKLISFGDKVPELRELEKEFPKLGLAAFDSEDEGISTLSIMATITDVLCGKRFSIIVDKTDGDYNNQKILGVKLIDFNK